MESSTATLRTDLPRTHRTGFNAPFLPFLPYFCLVSRDVRSDAQCHTKGMRQPTYVDHDVLSAPADAVESQDRPLGKCMILLAAVNTREVQ